LNDVSFKYAFSYYPKPGDLVEFGIQSIYHAINPGYISSPKENSSFNDLKLPTSNTLEHAFYASHTTRIIQPFPSGTVCGFHCFKTSVRGKVFKFNELFIPTDTLSYSGGQIFNTYAGLEPRVGVSWLVSSQFTLKGSYANTRQYLQLASNSASTTPLDVWYSASPNVKPQISDQVALGLDYQQPNTSWTHSMELYYKKNHNAIDFKDHPTILLNEALEGEIRRGKSTSMGVEFLSAYNGGDLNGWIAYTLSRSVRKIPGVNRGKRTGRPMTTHTTCRWW
jgi:outer membrane receptor protein involved in Fe transport